jgi:hypothetical protein
MEESWIIDLKYEHDLASLDAIMYGEEHFILADNGYCAVD